jgi:glycosyltransferase involved in cell wall biosynthesis
MIQLMLEGFGGYAASTGRPKAECGNGVDFFHVNARVSDDLRDVGGIRIEKLFRVLKYCAQAIWCRFRYGVTTLYYVPAPIKRSAILRDWIVMSLCRPFFPRLILHWHAVGLGHWAAGKSEPSSGQEARSAETQAFPSRNRLARWLTRRLLFHADLSVVLTDYNRKDAELLAPKRIEVVPNGVPDPCPDFEPIVLPLRLASLAARRNLLSDAGNRQSEAVTDGSFFRILFLAHCTREKGLFDTLDAVALANASLRDSNSPFRLQLVVAGGFMSDRERQEFEDRIRQPDLFHLPPVARPPAADPPDPGVALPRQPDTPTVHHPAVQYVGFVSGAEKDRLFREHDCVCFPSRWESFGLTMIEGFAFGMPVVGSAIPNLRELAPPQYPLLVQPGDTRGLATKLMEAILFAEFEDVRGHFCDHFTAAIYAERLASALVSVRGQE